MDPNEDPMDYMERLLTVQYQFEDDIHERQLLKQFLSGCNAKYKPSILQIYRANPKVTTSELAEKLQIDFRLSEALDSSLLIDQDTIEHETVLAQVGSARPFPRNFPTRAISTVDPGDKTCFLCGNKGHLMHQCPLKGSGQAPVVPKCEFCNRYGHRTEYCWEKEENAYRRPTGWTSLLPAKAKEDAALVSFSLMEIDDATDNEINTECEDVGAVVDSLANARTDTLDMYAFPNVEDSDLEGDDDDTESPVQLLPLESASVAYVPPAVYRTPTRDTIDRDIMDSEDDMELDPDYECDRGSDEVDVEIDDDFYDCQDDDMRSLSPAWSDDNVPDEGTVMAPIDLTAIRGKITDRAHRAPTAAAKNEKLFSDTSDEEAPDPSPAVVDLTH